MIIFILFTMNTTAITRYTILICFFATGATGLIYEIVWTRMLILAFGSTQFAITTVLTAFMAGLAIGSLILGRLIDRYKKPLLAYGLVEMGIGVYCILTPYIFAAIREFYLTGFSVYDIHHASFSLTQFLLAFAGIILPTTLMGGTLPILTRYFTLAQERIGFNAGMLYSINTLGAVIGCTLTGFLFLYTIGVNETVYIAGIVDIAIGILVIALEARGKGQEADSNSKFKMQNSKLPGRRVPGGIILSIFALSGFAALAYEVLWFRIFSLIIGSSIYAFTIMLATFLSGIGIGSVSFAPFIDKKRNPILWFALLEFIIGLSILITVPLYRELPFIFLKMFKAFSTQFWIFLLMQSLLCSAIMIVPTLCMGAIFPAVSKIYTKSFSTIGKGIGDIYFFNTSGAIFGSFLGGFVFIPLAGIQKSIIILTGINVLLGLILLLLTPVKMLAKVLSAVVIITSLLIIIPNIPPWDRMIMTTGPYANPFAGSVVEVLRQKGRYGELLFYKEGINAVITVRREVDGKTISYQSNGKYEAKAVDSRPAAAWSILGHIPLLLSNNAKDALLIGIGSGITLGAMEKYPLKKIDVVEIEPAVIESARYFISANDNALDDPRVTLHITDGRNFLFTTKNKYDVIISAVSDPWITGVSNLFTQEYFNEIKNKLKEDGVVAIWFQNYRISTGDLKIGLNTFASIFPYVSIWFHYAGTSDLILIGAKGEISMELDSLYKKMADDKVERSLKGIDINNPFDIFNLFLIGNNDIRAYIKGASINTDNKPILEFTLPRQMYSPPGTGANERVLDMLANANDFIPSVVVPEGREADFYYRLGVTYSNYVFREKQAIKLFKKVLDINPENTMAKQYLKVLSSPQ